MQKLSVIFILIFPFCLNGRSQSILINEILAVNNTILADEDGDYSDWIELYNTTSQDISLEGWSITDNKSVPGKWIFPDVKLGKNSYLLIFASEKNRRTAGKELHTNFRLSSSGEYLAISDPAGNIVSSFDPFYPYQEADISYGYFSGALLSFINPTPGRSNQYSTGGILPPPLFSREHGFYDAPFKLELQCPDKQADIWYTVNGSEPGEGKGLKYSGPVTINSSCVIRAVSVKEGSLKSRVSTASYLFAEDIIRQPNDPAGYPDQWGAYTGISGTAIADYEMDPEMISDPVLAEAVVRSLKSLPVISLATDRGNIFSRTNDRDTGGIYIYTGPPLTNTTNGTGFDWERPVSFEYFNAAGSVSLQTDCILQLHGGHSRRAEKSPKHSFRLEFKSSAGPSRLNFPLFGEGNVQDFNSIILRAGFNNSWVHHSSSERIAAQYVLDIWVKDSHRGMGHPASNSIFTHLFINGLYWGIYSPSEKIDNEFAATYLGGNKEDYDVIKDYTEVADGNKTAWNIMMNHVKAGLSSTLSYQKLQGNKPDGSRDMTIDPMVDVVSLADYMILNFYAGNSDWDHHNWIAVRNRVNPGKGFSFLCWDEEKVLENINTNILNENNPDCPSYIYQKLTENADFRRLLSDRIQKFCFGDGILTPQKALETYTKRSGVIGDAIEAESARWGDYRRDVHRWQNAGPFEIYTKEDHWQPQLEYLNGTYFPRRTDIFLNQLRAAGLFPGVNGPEFKINGEPYYGSIVVEGDTLEMTSNGGTIYYTTDGSDPVNWYPFPVLAVSARIYNKEIIISHSAHFKARVLEDGEWSATGEVSLIIPSNYYDLRITELNYHPADQEGTDGREFEFIELKNTGISTLDMSGIKIREGINYTFGEGVFLGPGKFIVLAANPESFYLRYKIVPLDEYEGQLSNDGEMVLVLTPGNDTITYVSYSNSNGWPYPADGYGNSLVTKEINPDRYLDDPDLWRASYHSGGSPGADDIFKPELLSTAADAGIITVYQNYPNPFTDFTYFSYKTETEAEVEITVYDLNGKKICTVEKAVKPSGEYIITWDGRNDDNSYLPSGIYIYHVEATYNGKSDTVKKRLVFVR